MRFSFGPEPNDAEPSRRLRSGEDRIPAQRAGPTIAPLTRAATGRTIGKRVVVAFSDRTMTAIDATFPPERRVIWPLSVSREMMRRTFVSVAKKAGCGGTLKWLRAGSGTSVEELYGRGEQHLGNTRQVFERHYLCRADVARLPAAVPCR